MSANDITPVEAYSIVVETINTLRDQHKSVCEEIKSLTDQIAAAPLMPVPFSDLKQAVLDMVDASGAYFETEVKSMLRGLVTKNDLYDPKGYGYPLRYDVLLRATDGKPNQFTLTPLISSSGNKMSVQDIPLYCFFAETVKARLTAIMENMSPEDFGYGRLTTDQIGSDRATRAQEISDLQSQLAQKEEQKAQLAAQLSEVGITKFDY